MVEGLRLEEDELSVIAVRHPHIAPLQSTTTGRTALIAFVLLLLAFYRHLEQPPSYTRPILRHFQRITFPALFRLALASSL